MNYVEVEVPFNEPSLWLDTFARNAGMSLLITSLVVGALIGVVLVIIAEVRERL